MTSEQLWLSFGLMGQLLFTGRFIVQWLCSERQGKSVIPPAFWYLSISGAMVLLMYAIYRGDPVFVLGQSTGMLIYLRNLQLLSKSKRKKEEQHGVPATLALVRAENSHGTERSARHAA